MSRKDIVVELSKYYNRFHVLNNIKFNVRENEFLCIVGPSGCGKTTLLQTIVGLTPLTEGRVVIGNEPIDLFRHHIAFVFQEPSCLPWRTVAEDVAIGLEFRGYDGDKEERIREVLKTVGLNGFEKYYPNQLSGGMKQRVAIARAFTTHPDLLLMDEPFGHLDAQTRYYMQIATRKIWEQMKATVIFVTNDVEEAIYLGERILMLSPVPATIKAEIPISLPHPRDQTSPEFLELRKHITSFIEVKL